ncbi:hypothetical protein SteCoe_9235 [Stentor coeruleus]|uniref:Uncharacterized protein n=1 Tax=Stentor coeruleus TaxID=5963 RepID=A0A1R2CII9_9CILI|nr:hypothetical protein SteCoe_9235 [Stentor coeruleus]
MQCLKKFKPRKNNSVSYSIILSPAVDVETRENHHNANFFHDSNTLSPHHLTNNYIRNQEISQTAKIISDRRNTIPDLIEIRSISLESGTKNPKKLTSKNKKKLKNTYHRSRYCQIF